jgi:hypothetical protein
VYSDNKSYGLVLSKIKFIRIKTFIAFLPRLSLWSATHIWASGVRVSVTPRVRRGHWLPAYLSLSKANAGTLLCFGHNRFLPNPFPFTIIPVCSYHPKLYSLDTGSRQRAHLGEGGSWRTVPCYSLFNGALSGSSYMALNNTECWTGKNVAECGHGFILDIIQALCFKELQKTTEHRQDSQSLGRDWNPVLYT